MSKSKTSIIVLALVLSLGVGSIVEAATPGVLINFLNKNASKTLNKGVLHKNTTLTGTVSGKTDTLFTLTTKDGKVYTISLVDLNKKQADRVAKRAAQDAKRAALNKSGKQLTSRPLPNPLANLKDGVNVNVTIAGTTLTGTTFTALNVHVVPTHGPEVKVKKTQ